MHRNISRDGCYGENFQFVRGSQGSEEGDCVVGGRIGIDDDGARHVRFSAQLIERLLRLRVPRMLFEKIEQNGARLVAIALQAVNAREI